MIKIAICDDSSLQRTYLTTKVKEYIPQYTSKHFQIENFKSPEEMEKAIETQEFQLALLDIDYGENRDNGIELAQRINSSLPRCQIIFITSHVGYVSQVYETDHAYLVLKKEIDRFLPQALARAMEILGKNQEGVLCVKYKKESYCIPMRTIIYIESSGRNSTIHTREKSYLVTEKLEAIQNRLPEPTFVRCHQSYIVNFNYISSMNKSSMVCRTGKVIPISRSRCPDVKIKFGEFASAPM